MSSTVEITTLNLRYETHRMRESAREARLLALIAARGIRQPLEGVDTADGRFLLNGFKRLRCARQLSLGCVPYESIAADIECFLKAGWPAVRCGAQGPEADRPGSAAKTVSGL